MKPFNLFPYGINIHFMRLRWVSLAIAALLMFVSIETMIVNSFPGGHFNGATTFNYALDFTGGTVTELRFSKATDVDVIRQRLDAAGLMGAQVQNYGASNDLLIRLRSEAGGKAAAQTAEDIVRAVSAPDNPAKVVKSDFVGPQVGKELALNGFYALLF